MAYRVALSVLAAVTVVGLLGCGGGSKGKVTFLSGTTISASECPSSGCGVSLHSPSHRYSVEQVEAAFASQGIDLHTGGRTNWNGLISRTLAYSRGRHMVTVHVTTHFPKRNVPYALGYTGSFQMTDHRNVMVIYDPADRSAVKTALAELH